MTDNLAPSLKSPVSAVILLDSLTRVRALFRWSATSVWEPQYRLHDFTVGTSIASVLTAWAGTLLPALADYLLL